MICTSCDCPIIEHTLTHIMQCMTGEAEPTKDLPDPRFLSQYIVRIHWDDEHQSPAIGPFNGATNVELWCREFRKLWRKVNPNDKLPKLKKDVLRVPTSVEGWVRI